MILRPLFFWSVIFWPPAFRRGRFVLAVLLAIAVVPIAPLSAHEGHDHGDAAKPIAAVGIPALEAASSAFEIVAVPQGNGLLIHLDRFATNEPVTGAVLEVAVDGEAAAVSEAPDGIYRATSPGVLRPGRHALTFTVTTATAADLLIGSLDIPADIPAPAAAPVPPSLRPAFIGTDLGRMVGAAAIFLLGVSTTLALTGRGGKRAVAAGLFVTLAVLLAGGAAFAHGGDDHSHAGEAKAPVPTVTAGPQRLPDGSLHVPKGTQRLLGIRTVVSKVEETAGSVALMGRVIPDPNYGGHVQASQSGRIEPGEQGLPYLGQRVEAGQILAYVVPAVNMVERTGVQQQMAQLDRDVALAQVRVERLSGLAGSVPQKDIDEARTSLEGLRRQRQTLVPTLTSREPLRAPVSGVIAASSAAVGQFVDARDQVLFEIVDPARLLVEAAAFDLAAVAGMTGATAMVGDGGGLPLSYVGRGVTLKQQAIPVLFRILQVPEGLSIGQPVHVLVRTGTKRSGILLPRESVVRTPNGQSVVWEHDSPQRFIPRPVRVQPVDGDRVLVSAGLGADARIVTDGAGLLNQVR